jgi:hypothetical protein
MNDRPCILLIGNDPPLEYLLERYAFQGGYRLQSIHSVGPDTDVSRMRPQSIWFSSLEALEASQPHRNVLLACNVPIVVCSSIADNVRAMDLGADYLLVHPLTYDNFINTLAQG